MKLLSNILKSILVLIFSLLIAIVFGILSYYIALGASWLLGIDNEYIAFGSVLVMLLILIVTFIVLKLVYKSTKIFKTVSYTITYWVIHPLIVRPYKTIVFALFKKERKEDYLDRIRDGNSMLKNDELNNAKHRLNYINFVQSSLKFNNKILYNMNLKQMIIQRSTPEKKMIIESKFKTDIENIQGIEDSFGQRRKALKEERVAYRYKKENKRLWLTIPFLILLTLTFFGAIAMTIASAFVNNTTIETDLIFASVVSITVFVASLMIFSIIEYRSIKESKIYVSKREAGLLQQNTLYQLTNLTKFHDGINGLLATDYALVDKFIKSTNKSEGIIDLLDNYISTFGSSAIDRSVKDLEIDNEKQDEVIKEKQLIRLKDIVKTKRKEFKENL